MKTISYTCDRCGIEFTWTTASRVSYETAVGPVAADLCSPCLRQLRAFMGGEEVSEDEIKRFDYHCPQCNWHTTFMAADIEANQP